MLVIAMISLMVSSWLETAPNHYIVPKGTCKSLCDNQVGDTVYVLTWQLKKHVLSLEMQIREMLCLF
jgi:hypothetical protein